MILPVSRLGPPVRTSRLHAAVLALAFAACGTDDTPLDGAGIVSQIDAGNDDTRLPDAAMPADSGEDDILDPQQDGGLGPDANPSDGGDSTAPNAWSQLCTSCHGLNAVGGIAPALRPWTRDRATLVHEIATRMPPDDPRRCGEDCAVEIADWLLIAEAPPPPAACDEDATPRPALRTVRALTRDELANTLGALLGPPPTPCGDITDCALDAVCTATTCAPLPCGEVQFAVAIESASDTVHIAGSFNDWAGSIAAGGLPLTDQGDGFWSARAVLPPGAHAYKIVINGNRWLVDPRASQREPDGFGGQNSVVTIACDAPSVGAPPDTRGLAAEIRPTAFLFNTHVRGITWTAGRVEDTLALADQLVRDLSDAQLVEWLGCDPRTRDVCRDTALHDLLERVFRSAPSPGQQSRYATLRDSETDPLAGFRLVLRAALASPLFLYRTELGEVDGDSYRLTSYEIAQAMSYALWGEPPDATLLALARTDALYEPDVRAAQATRMLADARARSRFATFSEQWLGIERVRSATRSTTILPDFSQRLRDAMVEETRRFVTHVVFDSTGRLSELLRADYTLANADLARLYNWEDITGTDFRPINHGDAHRSGFLGHAAVLAASAHSDQTSPIRRGLFIRRHLLCQEFPEPPADANGVPEVDPGATTRERFRQHTDDTFCASCHTYIDPTGFGFERFDPVGRLRDTENGQPIDSLGDMNDVEGFGTGTSAPFTDLAQLARTLDESRAANACFVRQYHRFASGLGADEEDACTMQALEDAFLADGGHIPSYLVALVRSETFIRRR